MLRHITLTLVLLMLDKATWGDTASSDSILMTPYWDHLRFGEGESASVDCGVYTNGKPDEFKMTWFDSKRNEINNGARTTVKRNDSISGQETEKGAYSVLTLTISNLTQDDNQTYICEIKQGTATAKKRQITINVLTKDKWYGFEGKDLSGWKTMDSTSVQWHKHNATDKVIIGRSKGPRYDHTYGPSKHIGHFIELDLEHQNATTVETVELVSPTYQAKGTPQCLYFWYILEAGDIDEFSVLLKDQVPSKQIISPSKEWKVRTYDIPVMNKEYQIMFQTTICNKNCTSGAVALDDIAIVDGLCNSSTFQWPKTNTMNVRLTGRKSDYEGRVEVLHDGQYGTACSDKFNKKDAAVICRQLGFSYNNANITSVESQTKAMIWLNNVACHGSEKDIGECLGQNEFFGSTCKKGAAVIKCTVEPVPNPKITTKPSKTTTTTKGPESTIHTDTNNETSSQRPPNTTTITPKGVTTTKTTTTHPSNTTTLKSTTQATTTNVQSTTTAATVPVIKPVVTKGLTSSPATTKSSGGSVTNNSTKNTPSVTFTTGTQSSTSANNKVPQTNTSSDVDVPVPDKHGVSKATRIGGGVVAGIVIIVLLGVLIFAILVYKGRKRRMRKSKYLNFGSASYSREHLPTNEFHLESPLTMSSMGYTVLA